MLDLIVYFICGGSHCSLTWYFYVHNCHCLVCRGPRPRQRCRSLKENHATSSFHRWADNE